MTIAACYVSADGIVFGADSTTTMFVADRGGGLGSEHHYNYAQKIFEIGEKGTLAIAMWGLGNLRDRSYRTLIAQFSDSVAARNVESVEEVASLWSSLFWEAYSTDYADVFARIQALANQGQKTPEEEEELLELRQGFDGGFCIGGHVLHDRNPKAFEILYSTSQNGPSVPVQIDAGTTRFWGCPNLIQRLLYGIDLGVMDAILTSGLWSGTDQQLYDSIIPYCLGQPRNLPIREAIDWVFSSIYTTIKTMKFSHMAPVCGGPVEVAVITSDRRFRWVRHKGLDAAINDGGLYESN